MQNTVDILFGIEFFFFIWLEEMERKKK